MTDCEKLMKLIAEAKKQWDGGTNNIDARIADHLIANSVIIQKWIPVTEAMPKEYDSMFAKWYGTPLWKPGMFRTTSGDVLVCVEFGEGSRLVSTARTNSGEWNISSIFSGKVTHWMPLPEPPKEGDS